MFGTHIMCYKDLELHPWNRDYTLFTTVFGLLVSSLDDCLNCCVQFLNWGKYVSVKLSWDFQHLTWESLVEGIPLGDFLCLSPKFPSFDYFGKVHLATKSQIIYVFYSLAQNPGQFKFPFRWFNPKHVNSA